MAIGTLSPVAIQQFFDANGNPLAGGTLQFFLAGSDILSPAYADENMTVPLANPVVLDAAGRAPELFLAALSYKQVLKNALGTTIWTADNIRSVGLIQQQGFQPVVTVISTPATIHNVDVGTGHNRILQCANTAGDIAISGFAGGTDGDTLLVVATGTKQVYLYPEDGGSALANRIVNRAKSGPTPLVGGYGWAYYEYLAVTQRWVLIAHDQGHFLPIAYNAGNFTAAGGTGGTWTVDAADVKEQRYMLVGATIQMSIALEATVLAGGTAAELRVGGWPYAFSGPVGVNSQITPWSLLLEAGTVYSTPYMFIRNGERVVNVAPQGIAATFPAGTLYLSGQSRIEVV